MSLSRLGMASRAVWTSMRTTSTRMEAFGTMRNCSKAFLVPRPRLLSTATTRLAQGNQDLVQFLTEEIKAEKENLRELPPLDGFQVKQDNAELTISKEFQGEKILITLNVNHTVDSAEPDDGTQEAPEMKSKPSFDVDIVKDDQTLSFSCSFCYEDPESNPDQAGQEEYDDIFAIDEVTLYKGEWQEKCYAVAGDILDGHLYDLFMNMLDERGVTQEFADKMSTYCSSYEHTQYIKMLEDIQKFAQK